MRLVVVDSVGGSLASMGAAIARSLRHADAAASSTAQIVDAPAEVERVLGEIGLAPVRAERADTTDANVVSIEDSWGARLYAGEGDLERMANARIARDRIERRMHEILDEPLF